MKRVYRIAIISHAQQIADNLGVNFDVPDDMPDSPYPYIIIEATEEQAREYLLALGFSDDELDSELRIAAGEEVVINADTVH